MDLYMSKSKEKNIMQKIYSKEPYTKLLIRNVTSSKVYKEIIKMNGLKLNL